MASHGSTPEQYFKLLDDGEAVRTAPLFDLIVLDEASQMDVAHAILPIASIAQDGALVIAGDPKQLSPSIKQNPRWPRKHGGFHLLFLQKNS